VPAAERHDIADAAVRTFLCAFATRSDADR
jgi:hypothetical protein